MIKIQKNHIYFVVLGLAGLTALYHLIYAQRIIPGVIIGNTKVGGMTYEQAKDALEKSIQNTTKILTLIHDGKEYKITDEDISLEYKLNASVSRAYEVGRTKNLLRDNRDKLVGLIKPLMIKAYYDFDDEELSNKVLVLKGEINDPEINSTYELEGKDLKITQATSGKVIDSDVLSRDIIYALDFLSYKPIKLQIKLTQPSIIEDNLQTLKDQTKEIVYNPFKISHLDQSWNLTPEQVLEFLTVEIVDGKPELKLNKITFESFLQYIGQDVNTLPRGQVTEERDGKVLGFKLIKKGEEIDKKKFTEEFKKALFLKENSVALTMREINESEDTNRYGILSLLATGTSKYTGSIPNRVRNLQLAASKTNNVLVEPGGIYSMNKTIGEISGRTGYDSAYIISNGRTVLGEGGGVCQTSTTLFRAVLNAGLPVVSRYPHAYRVKYYELDSPPGIDAAIFQPSLDFQFKNDTPNYILIESSWNNEEDSLTFKIYGTPDNRKVEISEPVVTNVTAPPEPSYIDDPTLAAGVFRQVDFPAWGATATFNRTVTRDDEIITKDTYTSRYQAWRAVFLRGTKQ